MKKQKPSSTRLRKARRRGALWLRLHWSRLIMRCKLLQILASKNILHRFSWFVIAGVFPRCVNTIYILHDWENGCAKHNIPCQLLCNPAWWKANSVSRAIQDNVFAKIFDRGSWYLSYYLCLALTHRPLQVELTKVYDIDSETSLATVWLDVWGLPMMLIRFLIHTTTFFSLRNHTTKQTIHMWWRNSLGQKSRTSANEYDQWQFRAHITMHIYFVDMLTT